VEKHFRILGYIFLAWAALRMLAVVPIIIVWGAVAHGLLPEFAAFLVAPLALLVSVLTLLYLVAGLGLLARGYWARVMAIVVSILSLFEFPLGTALGIYGLWTMMSAAGEREFREYAAP
jgi:hypothetical protein